MNSQNMAVLTNIIGAVESGGQIYGNRRYEAYAGPYTNSSKEITCTLGWAQNYGNEGRKLCKMILKKDPVAFREADTANIESKLSVDWVAAKWAPTTAQKNALIAIITTDAGKECQDALFAELMEKYIKSAQEYGVTDVQAQMMWCEIEHLGGLSPTKRIFNRAAKPYTPDTIYASLIKDQSDTSNNNQVGDKKFQSRHECCVKWIKQYAVAEGGTTVGVTAQDVLNVMRSWLGYNESNGKYKQIIDLYNSHKPLARGYAVQYDDEWCDTCVSAAAIKAGAVDLIGTECGCEEHIKIFKQKGIWIEDGTITPKPGYIILYNWGDSTQPNDGYSDHIGYIETVSGGKITAIEGNKGGAVARRTIAVGHGNIRGYAAPKYADSSSTPTVENEIIAAGQVHANNFSGCGLEIDGIRGTETKKAGIKVVQNAMNLDYNAGLEVDGVWGPKSAAALDGHYVKRGETQYMVTALEILFMLRGYECGGVESPGVFGDGLEETVTMYKGKKGWKVNGTAGEGTFISLMGVSA